MSAMASQIIGNAITLYLVNRLFMLTTKKTHKLVIFCKGNPLWPMDSSHKLGSVRRKLFSWHEVILWSKIFPVSPLIPIAWWRHQMETFSALLALCAGTSPVTGEFRSQRPLTAKPWSFLWSTPEQSWNGSANDHDAGDLRRHCAHHCNWVISSACGNLDPFYCTTNSHLDLSQL